MEFFEGFLLVPFLGIVVTLPSEELSLGVLLASLFLLSQQDYVKDFPLIKLQLQFDSS